MSSSKPIFLDVDPSIIENSLRIMNEPDDEFNKMLFSMDREPPSKVVKPHPGFCIKTKEVGTDIKVFVNICTTDGIPPPKAISRAELEHYINTDDGTEFKVPMSIGEVRSEKDKHGVDAKVVDIAINPAFFQKIQAEKLFKDFFLTVLFQAVLNKHGLLCVDTKVILNNRKAFGTLQSHRIQQREIDEGMREKSAESELNPPKNPQKKFVIETISSQENPTKEPEYRLYKKKVGPNYLIGEFKLPDVVSAKEITVDVGEDRIVVESHRKGYFLDIFVPYCIRIEKCTSSFDKALKILTVVMPLIGG